VVPQLSKVELWTKKPLQKVIIARKWRVFALYFSKKKKKKILQESGICNKRAEILGL
jgi:ribosomal protein L18E